MKLLVIFAASAMSAMLVVPTVTQAESGDQKLQLAWNADRHSAAPSRA